MLALSLITVAGGLLAAVAAADIEIPWYGQVALTVAGSVSAFLVAQLGRALGALFDYLATRARIAKIAEVDEFIMGWVSHVAQHELEAAREAFKDGKLSPDEIARLKAIPIDAAKQHFGLSKLAKLASEGVEQFLASRVERAVVSLKIADKAATPITVGASGPI